MAHDTSFSLDVAIARARAAWPGVMLGEAEFQRYVEARATDGDVAALHVTDLYLVAACAEGDPIALAAVERDFFSEVPAMVERTGAPRAVGDDAAQVLREKLLLSRNGERPGIVAYTGRGALRGWLRVAAVRIAVSLRRGDRNVVRDDDVAAEGIDPELALIQARYGEAFRAAFAAALAALPASERAVLRLHFADGLNLERLATVLGLSRATAGSAGPRGAQARARRDAPRARRPSPSHTVRAREPPRGGPEQARREPRRPRLGHALSRVASPEGR